ncbi:MULTISPECIES: HAD family hydrolase [unclassified Arthrobacter]|uniref:HAD family hydrolase n=1 Tax=unclassified Arthrobacter TaxID=235627 RepID=UPI002E041842|nr:MULTISPECIES: HAD family hydrolase [unclassified Arthrobacter]MEC5193317.1 HAD superfamily hydrolase (TIGR01509 family) [Arthrobacter sp. MP_M4]MEC5204783.1 HAD superfamily hydrolase (TIGR01509 family) [Arthrobacter sp. MP_M7]
MTESPTLAAALAPVDAVIFDLDGVVTDTVELRAAAWQQVFDEALQDPRLPAGTRREPFSTDDYRNLVAGRTWEDAVTTFLGSRGGAIPGGSPADGSGDWTAFGLAARYNDVFEKLLSNNPVRAFPGTTDLLGRLKAGGIPVVLATSARNAGALLSAAGLGNTFDHIIDGQTALDRNVAGKPAPALPLEAVRRLGIPPARAMVIEESVTGVQAGRRGGFGLVVGIDRAGRRDLLEGAGASIIVEDVSQLDIGLVLTHPWLLVYEGFDPAHEGHREALTTLGNGYLATRGAAPEHRAGAVHYPGSYLAGVYNSLRSEVAGQETVDEHMVNIPDWLPLDLRIGDGAWWSEGGLTLRSERRTLDLKCAVLTREALLEDAVGRQLRLVQRRLVSMATPNLAALETVITAVGWEGGVSVRSGCDTDVTNSNVPEDAALSNRHVGSVRVAAAGPGPGTATLTVEARTVTSGIGIALALRTDVSGGSGPAGAAVTEELGGLHTHRFELSVAAGEPVTILKTVAVASSRDHAIAAPLTAVKDVLARAPEGFAALLSEHQAAWAILLAPFVIELDDGSQAQLILNLHVFHLLQTLTTHTAELDAGVPARGLHGEGYRGHVFWDELFVLPLLNSRLPSVARELVDYRWRRLGAARAAARAAGLKGAMFPWQSGSDGTEQTPGLLFNSRSGHWMQDHSRLQRHVGLAVAYNAWQYFEATQDRGWLTEHGAEIIVDVARFFASMAELDQAGDRFHLRGVMGPDEYHTGDPGDPGGGLDDNAYTNIMAAWVFDQAVWIMHSVRGFDMDELRVRLLVTVDEIKAWEHLSRRMYVPFHDDGVISQFEGYSALRELDWKHYRRTYGLIERLDLILEAEGDSTNHYRLAKQADVLMLLYVLGEDQLIEFLARMGYAVTPAQMAATVDFYLARTAHGSTLSRVAHASVLAQRDPERAWAVFREALDADLDDTQGGTTSAGIHLGAMAGTIDVVQRSFAGLRITRDALDFAPRLPVELSRVHFQVRYRDQMLAVQLERDRLSVSAAPGDAAPVLVRVGTKRVLLRAGEEHVFLREND